MENNQKYQSIINDIVSEMGENYDNGIEDVENNYPFEELRSIVKNYFENKHYIDNEPYIWEELCYMTGEPVWDKKYKKYTILTSVDDEQDSIIAINDENEIFLWVENFEENRFYPREIE